MPRFAFSLTLLMLGLGVFSDPVASQPPLEPPAAPPQAATPAAIEPLRTAGDHAVDMRNLRLDLKVDLPGKAVDARATLTFVPVRKLDSITLDAEDFLVKAVEASLPGGGRAGPSSFSHDGKHLVIAFGSPLAAGVEAQVVIDYRVHEPKQGLHFFGPSKLEPKTPLTCWSQGEAQENRAWIPCFDRPAIRQSSELVVTVAEGNEVLSNGKLLSKKIDPSTHTTTFHWKQEKPHPSYLISMVVGPFAIVEDRWRDKPVLYYVPPDRKGDAMRTFSRTPEMMELFSRKFGVDYPWEKYAQVVAEQFGGGMENTSATTLGDCLLDERSALDRDSDGLISHELGHQWWGDLVTCRDWAHIWLNEGFASYCECLWQEHRHGPDAYSMDVRSKKQGGLRTVDRPVVDRRYSSADGMFDARAYPKGAFILHMLRQQLGDDVFFAGLKHYLIENRYKSVETVDFRRAMEYVSGRDLERFFYDWTERPGHPKLEVNSSYDAEAKRVRVAVKQTQNGEPFHFPLRIRILASRSNDSNVFTEMITSKEQTIQIPVATGPEGVEIDPDQGVLAEMKEEKAHPWWVAQLQRGSTAYSRAFAAQQLGKSKSDPDRQTLIAALAAEKSSEVVPEIMAAMAASGGDRCRDALLAAYKSSDVKRRLAASTALRAFKKDDAIADAALATLTKGDPSVQMEAGAIELYARSQRPDTLKVLSKWLDKSSTREVLRSAAINGLATLEDPETLEMIAMHAKPGQPLQCQFAAVRALGNLAKSTKLSDKHREQAVLGVAALLSGEDERLRRSAISALQGVGSIGKAALVKLDAIAASDSVETIAEAAKKAAATIRGSSNAAPEVKQLREELDRLKKEQQELKSRLEKFEKQDKKGP